MKKVSGLSWSFLGTGITQVMSFFLSVYLTRKISPDIFGIYALAFSVVSLTSILSDTGFTASLIQTKDRHQSDYNAVYTLVTITSLVVYSVFAITILGYCLLYNQSFVLLPFLALGLKPIISSQYIVRRAEFWIRFDTKTIVFANILAFLIAACFAVLMIFLNNYLAALILNILVYEIVVACYFKMTSTLNLRFTRQKLKFHFSFATRLVASKAIDVIYKESSSLIIAANMNLSQLGYFHRANALRNMASNTITGSIQTVSSPALVEARNNDVILHRKFVTYLNIAVLLSFPITLILVNYPNEIIHWIYGSNWIASAKPLASLSMVGFLYVLNTFNLNLFSTYRIPGKLVKIEIFKKTIFLLCLVFARIQTIESLANTLLVLTLADYLITSLAVKKYIGWFPQITYNRSTFLILFYATLSFVCVKYCLSLTGIIGLLMYISFYFILLAFSYVKKIIGFDLD